MAPGISSNPDQELPGGGDARAEFWRKKKGLGGREGAGMEGVVMRVGAADRSNLRAELTCVMGLPWWRSG